MEVANPVVFSLAGAGQNSSGLLSAWIALSAPPRVEASFAIGEQPAGQAAALEGAVWRCDLPRDYGQARQNLDLAETSLHTLQAALDASTQQADDLIQRQEAASFAVAESVPGRLPAAFTLKGGLVPAAREKLDADQSIRLHQVERETLGLSAFSARAAAAPGPSFSVESSWDAASYGLFDDISPRWNEAVHQYQDFMGRLSQAVNHFAWVETRVEGQLQARTCVDWDGDVETGWSIVPDPRQAAQHARSLHLALTSRILLLRVFTVVGSTAVKFSALLGVPGGVILALPSALNFISQIKNELDRYQQQIKDGSS